MKKNLLLLLLLIPAIAFAQKKAYPQQFVYPAKVPISFDAQRLARIDSVFQHLVDQGDIPHAVTFVAHRGVVVHHKAFGWRDREAGIACKKDDIFRNASQTKAFTSVAILMLMEEGKLLLDDPVKLYIPEFADPQVLVSVNPDSTAVTRPAKRDITIRHLMNHTAGISYGNADTRRIYDKRGLPVSPMFSTDNRTLGEAIRILAGCPLEHDPGERFTYGMNTDVLGYVVEQVSGMPVDEFFRRRIFEPLGITSTWFYLPEALQNRLVKLYEYAGPGKYKPNERENGIYQRAAYSGAKTFFSTGAGLNGSIEDYARLCQLILNEGVFNGKRLLSRKTVEMMKKNSVGDKRGEIGYGLAFDDFRPEYSYRSIASEGSLRWGGWFGTDYLIDPKEELILLFYINYQPGLPNKDLKVLFHNLVYQALQ